MQSKTFLWWSLVVIGIELALWVSQLHATVRYSEKGLASWYGEFFEGRPTASAEPFSSEEMTAAHRQLPLGTKVMVQNLETGQQVEVRITDRGPYVKEQKRIIDLSRAAAASIGLVEDGVGQVRVVVTEPALDQQDTEKERRYEIQVGTFTRREEALKLLKKLHDRYPAGYIASRDSPLGPYYRVRIGPFQTEHKAEQIAQALTQQGHNVFLDEVLP